MDPRSPDTIFAKLQAFMDGKKLFVTVEGQIADSALRNALEGRGSAAWPEVVAVARVAVAQVVALAGALAGALAAVATTAGPPQHA